MKHLGNLTEDQIIDFMFPTHKSDGTPITFAGTPVVKVYKGNATGTEVATGVTLTVDFDGVTGLNHVRIDTSAAAFYAIANDYSVVITAGTVDGVNVVGTVLATFSIENRYGDLSASGLDSVVVEAGLNARQALSVIAAAVAGKLSGAATTEVVIKAAEEGLTTRITATVDADGNRTALTLGLPT